MSKYTIHKIAAYNEKWEILENGEPLDVNEVFERLQKREAQLAQIREIMSKWPQDISTYISQSNINKLREVLDRE